MLAPRTFRAIERLLELLLCGAIAAAAQIQNQPDDGQWTMAAKNYASTRFSTLDQINTGNVRNLRVAWTFSTGLTRGHEAAPLVVNNTMYLVTPWPDLLYAFDLTKPGAPAKWVFDPKVPAAAQVVACCDVVNRGAAYYKGRIYYNTLDVHTVAVDATTGKELWKTTLGDINLGESITMAPIVVKGKVLVGNSGGEFGVRGWLAGVDADSGKLLWLPSPPPPAPTEGRRGALPISYCRQGQSAGRKQRRRIRRARMARRSRCRQR